MKSCVFASFIHSNDSITLAPTFTIYSTFSALHLFNISSLFHQMLYRYNVHEYQNIS